MANDITELLDALRSGNISLAEVASNFRTRSWPRRSRKQPETYLEMAAAAQADPDPQTPGSFDEVLAAYDRGELTWAQYRVLAEAAAEAKLAQDKRDD